MLHIIWSIILGFIAGAIANFIMHAHMGFLWTTILGIVGSIVGGLIARIFSKPADGAPFHPAGLILSVIGAIVVLFIAGRFM
ncbi:MAG TPA: GlsB/YeaQ/YmgE family stress response membrane protein [Chthoniobacterales bacterium]|nr:GlsB/YeaQ/YmgE family stress response membrane protein [Chthoniobacterales bacterium]